MKLETRFTTNDILVRSGENKEVLIYGYAALYNNRSKLLIEGGKTFYEIIRNGAFIEGLANSRDIIMSLDHDRYKLLARTKSGTLILRSDEKGLYFEFNIPDTTLGRDTLTMIESGDISELSFAFYLRNIDFEWSRLSDGTLLREITNFKSLKDVSLLQTDAAYNNTDVVVDAREYEEIERKLNSNLDDYYIQLKNNFYN